MHIKNKAAGERRALLPKMQLPIDCLVRVMAFAGQLGQIDGLCKEFRKKALSKRLLYTEFFRQIVLNKLPRDAHELADTMAWNAVTPGNKRLHTMLLDMVDLVECDEAERRHKEAAHADRVVHFNSRNPRVCVHSGSCLRLHVQRSITDYTDVPPELHTTTYDDAEWQRRLIAHRVALFWPDDGLLASNGLTRLARNASALQYRLYMHMRQYLRLHTTSLLALAY
jgi:hypothetical protein